MRKILSCSLPLLVALFGGCAHAQVPPTAHNVALAWSAPVVPTNPPAGTWKTPCSVTDPCTYIVSRTTVASGTCPTPNLTTPNYTPLNSSTPVAALGYTDTTAAGLNACYTVQTSQDGNVGAASNTAGPFFVSGGVNPLAPTLNGTSAKLELPKPTAGYPGSPVMVYYTTGTLKDALKDAPAVAVLTGRVR
ncbi:MAG: hypothetical protein ACJ71S_06550 [Acidobacteriaceae bacterium]|jgi:hypothetical protein